MRSDAWISAIYERKGRLDLGIHLFEARERGDGPTPEILVGVALKCLHFTLGGHPDQPNGVVMAEDPVLETHPFGQIQSILLRPDVNPASAEQFYIEVMDQIAFHARKLAGNLGLVCRSSTLGGAERVEFDYGPALGLAKTSVRTPIVELAVAFNLRTALRPRGDN